MTTLRALARSRFINIAGLALALLILAIIVQAQTGFFLKQNNLLNIGRAVAVTGMIAAVTTITLIGGELDLSVGAALGLGGIVSATVLAAGAPLIVVLLAGLATGLLVGALNAGLVVGIGVNPLIATLGTMFALRGAAYIFTNGSAVVTFGNDAFGYLGNGKVAGIPVSVILLGVVFAIVGGILTWTRFGSNVYAIGGDRDASRLAGVPVRRVRILIYLLSATTAAFAGLLLASVNGSADPVSGTGIELVVIGSVILGGTALTGGRGGVIGTLLGVIFLGALANGMNLLGLPGYWQLFVEGVVLVAAVVLDKLVNRS
ncbi:MAG: ABC transporter permease [Chloroflexota bacterium]